MDNFASLLAALDQLQTSADELRDLDAVLGDGDLGITVGGGAAAVQAVLRSADDADSTSDLLIASARAFGNANPSTFAALTQGALLAAAKVTRGLELPLTTADLISILTAGAESIAKRGGANPGDKTVLDPLLSSIETLDSEEPLTEDVFARMATTADRVTNALADAPSSRGRAAWMGERSVGHRDPGSVAYVRFLEALRDHANAPLNR